MATSASESFRRASESMTSMVNRLEKAKQDNRAAMKRAADTATRASRSAWTNSLSGRPSQPSRAHRTSTGGEFVKLIQWEVQEATYGGYTGPMVRFQDDALRARAKHYWMVQEVGTNASVTRIDTGETFTIPSQIGYKIPRRYVWTDGSGNFGPGDKQQLRTYDDVKNREAIKALGRLTVRNEIEGKHYIAAGWHAGRRQYQAELQRIINDIFPK